MQRQRFRAGKNGIWQQRLMVLFMAACSKELFFAMLYKSNYRSSIDFAVEKIAENVRKIDQKSRKRFSNMKGITKNNPERIVLLSFRERSFISVAYSGAPNTLNQSTATVLAALPSEII